MTRRAPETRIALVGILLALTLFSTTACGTSGSSDAKESSVVRVVDGDTVVVHLSGHDQKVRLIGVDTPETKDPRKPVQCFGKEASAFTSSLLPPGTIVRLERDIEERDVYDRLLAYVYRADDGTFVNAELARQGYASTLSIPPNVAHQADFTALADEARQAGRGLWSACGGPGVPAG